MKYIYKGMAMPGWGEISGSVLLGWHEKVSRRDLTYGSTCLTASLHYSLQRLLDMDVLYGP